MKIYKSKYGWSTTAHSKTKEGEKIECYQECQFKMGEEPAADEIEGDLIFRGKDGIERSCFFSSYNSKEGVKSKLVLILPKPDEQIVLNDGKRDVLGHTMNDVIIDTEELPFY
jgi:hypothetical protein